jgi:hypothetical protein
MAERTKEQEAELQYRARQLPWKYVVKMVLKSAASHDLRELPPIMCEWFDLNRNHPEGSDADKAELAKMDDIQRRMNETPASELWLGDEEERAPIGTWWIAVNYYLRDGKRWCLLRAYLHGNLETSSASPDENRRLSKIVALAGGDPKKLLLQTGNMLFFTWRA